jgi:hypothetical protein
VPHPNLTCRIQLKGGATKQLENIRAFAAAGLKKLLLGARHCKLVSQHPFHGCGSLALVKQYLRR